MNPKIGENIKTLRDERQVTQEQLADYLTISTQAVSKWENGVTTPDVYLFPAIAEFFDVTIDELFKVDMSAYKNKAARLTARYANSNRPEDYERAKREFDRLFAVGNPEPYDYFNFANVLETNAYNQVLRAEELYRAAMALGDEHAEFQLRYMYSKTSRNEQNIAECREKLDADPTDITNWRHLLYAYRNARRFDDALEIARQGLEIFPDNILPLDVCGDVLRELNRPADALAYWDKIIGLQPDFASALWGRAFAYNDLGDRENALAAWETLLAELESRGYTEETPWPRREIAKLRDALAAGIG
ncbi:MAG: helix-turn-helix domain-containing protein [Oscillospiraceae bacterium]|jgi:transcriptional regulator with XRE-family HTH domain|nr:helix-turn-helix domain-containing protein [Oscillospiraceae bacterium]